MSRPAALHTTRAAFATLGHTNPALRSRAVMNSAVRWNGNRAWWNGNRAWAHSVFAGRFAANRFWWHRHNGFVIGWFWPLFWPYLWNDVIDYTYWPYGYDEFWPYAYDDVYNGIYGPYAYSYGANGSYGTYGTKHRKYRNGPVNNGICNTRIPAWSDWPIEQITRQVVVDPSQQPALDELKNATAKAVQILQSACPSDVANTPLGRLQAAEYRLETMLEAVRTIRPALDNFYNALNDEQKARFNTMGTQFDNARVAERARNDLAEICTNHGAAMVPIEQIEQAVRPTQTQAQALEKLKSANASAAESLKANCPAYKALTPTGRVAAMEQRLDAAQAAVKTIEPALKDFYSSLSDEQKARFNSLRTRIAAGG
jgi:hypothetical protein